jgi:integrase
MIRVRENADGAKRYDVRLRGSNGRVVTKTFARRRAAERWERDQLAARDDGSWVDRRLGRQPLSDWFEEWWPTRTDLRPSTAARDESHYLNHVLPKFGDLPLAAIDYGLVTAWIAELQHKGLAPATVRRCHLLLSKLLAGAVRSKRISRNPCIDTDNLPTVHRAEMRVIDPEQILRLADAMFDVTMERLGRRPPGTRGEDAAIRRVAARFSALVILGGYGGLRFGELAGLRRNRIDTARRMVRVDSTLTEVRGQLIPGRPKTAAGVRSVPLPRTVAATLELAVRGLDDDAFVFTGSDGASAKQVQVWAGHRSVATVFDRYGHLFPGGEDPVMDSLDAAASLPPR